MLGTVAPIKPEIANAGSVLVVEDEPAMREFIARHFRRLGKSVVVAESAEEVDRLGYAGRAWDVVVTDVHLPGLSGIELGRRLSSRADSLVFVTGDPNGALAQQALNNLRAGYLLKPFELFELDALVKLAARPEPVEQPRRRSWWLELRRVLRRRHAKALPNLPAKRVPARAIALSIAALVAPASVTLTGGFSGAQQLLLWASALIPPFLLAYYRGWSGAAAALALGMAALASVQAAATYSGVSMPSGPILVGMVVTFAATCLGAGWLSETLLRLKQQAEANALTDPLTGLANRAHLLRFLESRFAAAQRNKTQLVVVFFDLDNFKRWNDELGHDAGDSGLVAFADVLRRNMRNMDLAGRYGGEEFLSVLTGSDAAGAMTYADRVRESLRKVELYSRKLTVSVGIASYQPDMRSLNDLINAADAAMYTAKSAGRDCVRRFNAPPAPAA
ncbi:MAG TPA: diguanylate cyclase [Longimicrobiales bacterium]|nr:diguanylate cyclase [Longimicrobiales bacterium]